MSYLRFRNIYDPKSLAPFKLSRTKIDLFLKCPRCFYFDRKLGISRPKFPAFTLNNAVDYLLKKEFDMHRIKQQAHPLMAHYGIDAIPFSHEKLDEWRDAFRRGVIYLEPNTNFIIGGGIDDVWITPGKELLIVDYKATSTNGDINLDDEWKQGYKKQMEVYQWLFRKNNFQVSSTGYFVYCNCLTDREAFDAKLEFDLKIIPYKGDDSWIEPTLQKIKECLNSDTIPSADINCEYCQYVEHIQQNLS